ncbi:MAG: hypothetical protein JO092_11005 [Candidatus Eremiobacteraeota bacterium]|nr:hypothetical protein [Candidatus Eremiobacteraeota bacterium]
MPNALIRLCFCLAVAVVAAAVADPLVEAASNAGWFGPGSFTDHSSIDVLPTFVLGCGFVVLYAALRVRRMLGACHGNEQTALRLSNEVLDYCMPVMLPVIFTLQIALLYSMETAEQFAVWGHALGGTIWIGGPVVASLAAHAVACVAATFLVARAIRSLGTAALRVLRLMRALATLLPIPSPPRTGFRQGTVALSWTFAPRSAGKRAPPLPA